MDMADSTGRPLSSHAPSVRHRSRHQSRSNTNTRMSSATTALASDHIASSATSSPQLQQTPFVAHRFHTGVVVSERASPAPTTHSNDSCRGRRPSLQASVDDLKASESRSATLTATSSYLQEKLLKERKVETERCLSRASNTMGSNMDLRATQSSPARPPFDIRRPKSSTGHLDASKKKGVGLKEMEQTLTTLHKQNFDLKLELYHRREKQSALEERFEAVAAEKRDLQDINDKLITELEMRDKAVEEAVAMIVSLEDRLEELLQERELARQQAAKEHFFATDAGLRKALSTALQNAHAVEDTKTKTVSNEDEAIARTIHRMPSFVSDHSELTENLRNVYLGTRGGSRTSLPRRVSEDNLDADFRDAANRIASPALSILSESSFLSIYGKKQQPREDLAAIISTSTPERPLSPIACVPDIARAAPELALEQEQPESLPGVDMENASGSAASVVAHALATTAGPSPSAGNSGTARRRSSAHGTPTKKRSTSMARPENVPANFQALTDFLGTNSPLQRLEKMEKTLQAMNEESQQGSGDDVGDIGLLARHLRAHEYGKARARQEKKDALRRVRTDGPFAREMGQGHNLPPTPDTISTSTLRRYKNSSDTLCLSQERDASYLGLSDAPTSRSTSGERTSSVAGGLATTTAFDNRRHEVGIKASFFDSPVNIPPRPRSACETTISHTGRGSHWGDSDSSDEDMDLDGNDSASLHDYWMRESLRPSSQLATSMKHSKGSRSGRVSPDLFRFPTTSNGWATTAIFGTLSGQGYHGSIGMGAGGGSAPLAQALDALGDSLPTPTAGLSGPYSGLVGSSLPYGLGGIPDGPPPPPHRRSSLHARTGSTHGSTSRSGSRHGGGTAPGTPLVSSSSAAGFAKNIRRSPTRTGTSGGPGATYVESSPQTVNKMQEQTVLPKQRHYPPASNGGGGGGLSRSRMLSLFRRSGSNDPNSAASAALAGLAGSSSTEGVEPSSGTLSTGEGEGSSKATSPRPAIGMPSWVRRSEVETDVRVYSSSSSTPPPILRNPRTPWSGSAREGEAATGDTGEVTAGRLATEDEKEAVVGKEQSQAPTPTDGSSSGRKKWLGLGRVTSLRTRTG